mgnify:CR=1 FL=1
MRLYKRERYLSKMRAFFHDDDLIKVITGIRRCGKSSLMQTIAEELKEGGVAENNIIYIDLDKRGYKSIRNAEQLDALIESATQAKGMKYLFIDEIQNVEGFEEVINGFRSEGDYSIFITGSNSYLLSGELLTKLTGRYLEFEMFPLTLEISTLIPVVIIFLNRKRFLAHQISQSQKCCKQLFAQGAESAIVTTRVVVIIAFLHFLGVFITILLPGPLSETSRDVLFRYCPPAVFILSILFNQFGILYFNQVMEHTAFVPIVNTKGDVIGRSLAVDAINKKNEYINPVVRIAVSHNGMLYLRPRPQRCILDRGKTDIPMECYLLYGETLEQGIVRLVRQAFPQAPIQDLQFNIMYHFENKVTNRLIYLFILDVEDDNLLRDKQVKDGKLWTFQQIEHNLGKNFFSCCFENEYEHLKDVICTGEKYKEF